MAADNPPSLDARLSRGAPGVGDKDKITVSRHLDNGTMQFLSISFHRTVRVADNATANNLPPSLDCFPLFNAADFDLSPIMAAKGGFFMPMYQREAMLVMLR